MGNHGLALPTHDEMRPKLGSTAVTPGQPMLPLDGSRAGAEGVPSLGVGSHRRTTASRWCRQASAPLEDRFCQSLLGSVRTNSQLCQDSPDLHSPVIAPVVVKQEATVRTHRDADERIVVTIAASSFKVGKLARVERPREPGHSLENRLEPFASNVIEVDVAAVFRQYVPFVVHGQNVFLF